MNIEIANRLVELRKKNNLSQEELAAKLELSWQTVSKWERAEAAPDTDNLICLAKIYNLSPDELVKFITSPGPIGPIAQPAIPKAKPASKEPLPLNDQIIMALSYFIVGLIAIALLGVALGIGSTALALLASGIGRLAVEGRSVTGASLTLYLGQIVLAAGLLLMLVGGAIKFSGILRKLVTTLQVKLGGARHE
jgi:transcriptional regulator with XRE-family HTH domain